MASWTRWTLIPKTMEEQQFATRDILGLLNAHPRNQANTPKMQVQYLPPIARLAPSNQIMARIIALKPHPELTPMFLVLRNQRRARLEPTQLS